MFLHTARYRHTHIPTDNTTLPIPFEKHNFPSTALSGCAKTSWCIFHNPSCLLLSPSPRSSTPLFRLLLNNHKIQPRWQHCNFVLASFFFISRLVPRRNKRTDTESTSIKFPCCCPHTSDTFRVLFPRGPHPSGTVINARWPLARPRDNTTYTTLLFAFSSSFLCYRFMLHFSLFITSITIIIISVVIVGILVVSSRVNSGAPIRPNRAHSRGPPTRVHPARRSPTPNTL